MTTKLPFAACLVACEDALALVKKYPAVLVFVPLVRLLLTTDKKALAPSSA